MNHVLVTLVVLFCLVLGVFASLIQVNPATQFFVDEYNRTRQFHGVNAVYKEFPYYPPVLDHFDANVSLCDEDLQNLQQWGLNVVRLHIAWQGVEHIRGQYNFTYLNILKQIVSRCEKYGIHVILDAHQDLLHDRYCGEGVPGWASLAIPDPQHPLRFPFPLPITLRRDTETGFPLREDCLKHSFPGYYFTRDVAKAFQNLYKNENGTRESFARFWGTVASYFKDSNILGYELLNEPFAGDIFSHPSLLVGGNADRENIEPMYRDLYSFIRKGDSNHMVFYQPMLFDIDTVGFKAGPGGESENSKQVFSFHVYCGLGDPKSKFLCRLLDDSFFAWRQTTIKRLGGGAFLSEFGAVSNSPMAVDEIHWMLQEAEKRMFSWTYWQFKWFNDFTTAQRPAYRESFYHGNGTLQFEKVKALSRTYAQAICGVPRLNVFEPKTGYFKLQYEAVECTAKPTEIYLNRGWYYPNGFTVSVTPSELTTVERPGDNFIHVWHDAALKAGQTVIVEIHGNK